MKAHTDLMRTGLSGIAMETQNEAKILQAKSFPDTAWKYTQ